MTDNARRAAAVFFVVFGSAVVVFSTVGLFVRAQAEAGPRGLSVSELFARFWPIPVVLGLLAIWIGLLILMWVPSAFLRWRLRGRYPREALVFSARNFHDSITQGGVLESLRDERTFISLTVAASADGLEVWRHPLRPRRVLRLEWEQVDDITLGRITTPTTADTIVLTGEGAPPWQFAIVEERWIAHRPAGLATVVAMVEKLRELRAAWAAARP